MNNYDTLVLSGGSMNGLFILGALQHFQDNKKLEEIKYYVGTSVGSIICYLIIIGYSPIEIMIYLCVEKSIFENLSKVNFLNALKGDGAISFSYIENVLQKMTTDKIGKLITMEELQKTFGKELYCITYNLTKGKQEIISFKTFPELDCIKALRMSSNIPLVFEKLKYNDCYYIDGGISDNFPIHIGECLGSKVLAVSVLTETKVENIDSIELFELLNKIMLVLLNEPSNLAIQLKRENTEIIAVEPNDKSIKLFDFSCDSISKLDFFSYGYNWVKNFYKNKDINK